MGHRHQIEKFTQAPFQPFQPVYPLFGLVAAGIPMQFPKNLLSRLFACYRVLIVFTQGAERKARSFVQFVSPAQRVYLNKWSTPSPC